MVAPKLHLLQEQEPSKANYNLKESKENSMNNTANQCTDCHSLPVF
jgi:hypothetical protein